MTSHFFRIVVPTAALLLLGMLAWGQGSLSKPAHGMPKVPATPITESGAYLLKEVQKLKKQVGELQTRLAAAESKNKSQDDKLANKEDKVAPGPDYAGGGWCTKSIFLNTLDPNKTMIHYISLK